MFMTGNTTGSSGHVCLVGKRLETGYIRFSKQYVIAADAQYALLPGFFHGHARNRI